MKNKFFTRQVCDCALLAQTLLYAQRQRRNEVIMKKTKPRMLVVGIAAVLLLSVFVEGAVLADSKTSLSKSKITVGIGKTKTIKVRNAGKKVSWKILSGNKNISIKKRGNSMKITGKNAGKAKLQARTAGKKLICSITVKKKSSTNKASDSKITVKSGKYTVVYQLNDSQAAKDLYAQLPLTLKVENFSDNEKIFYPPRKLKTKNTPKSGGENGSLSYYEPWGDVVMFYAPCTPNSSLYELGTVVSGKENIHKLSGTIEISIGD